MQLFKGVDRPKYRAGEREERGEGCEDAKSCERFSGELLQREEEDEAVEHCPAPHLQRRVRTVAVIEDYREEDRGVDEEVPGVNLVKIEGQKNAKEDERDLHQPQRRAMPERKHALAVHLGPAGHDDADRGAHTCGDGAEKRKEKFKRI